MSNPSKFIVTVYNPNLTVRAEHCFGSSRGLNRGERVTVLEVLESGKRRVRLECGFVGTVSWGEWFAAA